MLSKEAQGGRAKPGSSAWLKDPRRVGAKASVRLTEKGMVKANAPGKAGVEGSEGTLA